MNTLVKAGVLGSGTLLTTCGLRCIAVDGHECHSLAEKATDDSLAGVVATGYDGATRSWGAATGLQRHLLAGHISAVLYGQQP